MSMKPYQVQMLFNVGGERRRHGWRWWTLVAAAVVTVACVLIAVFIAISGLRDDISPTDAALVLGTRVERDGSPSDALQKRLDRAVELHKAGTVRLIIASGATGAEGFDESAVMRDYLIKHGVPAEQIVADPNGVDTFASAKNARAIADQQGIRSITAISQYYHLPRARLALRRFGFADVRSAHAYRFSIRDLYTCPREALAIVYYWLRSYR